MHFTGDFYQSFLSPLYPLLKDQLALSLTQVGAIAGVVTIASFICQPLMAMWMDRHQPRRFLFAGLLLSILMIPLLGVAPWFELILLLTGLGALGSSMYHPAAAGMVPAYAGHRAGLGMAVFGLGGTLAHSLGPLIVTTFIVAVGPAGLPLTSAAGLAMAAALLFCLPAENTASQLPSKAAPGIVERFGETWKAVMVIWAIGVMRSLVDVAIRTFYPILHMQNDHSLISVGAVLSLYTVGASISAVFCGHYTDRNGYKFLFFISLFLAPPAILAFLYAAGIWIYPAAFVAGFVLLGTMFPSVALSVRIAPGNQSLASSITLGLAVGTAGLVAPLAGRLAEQYGLFQVMTCMAWIPLLCLPLVPFLPDFNASPIQPGGAGWRAMLLN